MSYSWTIFGAGNFIHDIIDVIHQNGDSVKEIVLNQDIPDLDLKPHNISVKTLTRWRFKQDWCQKQFIGFINPNKEEILATLSSKALPHKLKFSNLIHPKAYVALETELGEGNYIGPGAVIAPKTKLGNFNFINRLASIGHHTQIGNYNHIGPGATVCGKCLIGNKNLFGAGSVVNDGITIKDSIILGSGGVAVKDLLEIGTYVGVPAKIKIISKDP